MILLWYSDGNHGKYWWNMMKFRCLSNGLCSLKNCHKPFGQGFRLPTHLGNAQIDTYFLIVGLPLNLYCKKIWIQSFSIHQHVVKCFGQNNWNVNDPRAELQNIRALVTFSRPCLHCFPDGLLNVLFEETDRLSIRPKKTKISVCDILDRSYDRNQLSVIWF